MKCSSGQDPGQARQDLYGAAHTQSSLLHTWPLPAQALVEWGTGVLACLLIGLFFLDPSLLMLNTPRAYSFSP